MQLLEYKSLYSKIPIAHLYPHELLRVSKSYQKKKNTEKRQDENNTKTFPNIGTLRRRKHARYSSRDISYVYKFADIIKCDEKLEREEKKIFFFF